MFMIFFIGKELGILFTISKIFFNFLKIRGDFSVYLTFRFFKKKFRLPLFNSIKLLFRIILLKKIYKIFFSLFLNNSKQEKNKLFFSFFFSKILNFSTKLIKKKIDKGLFFFISKSSSFFFLLM